MSNTVRIALAAAAVVAVVLVGYQLLVEPNVAGPAPSDATSPSVLAQEPSATPTPPDATGDVQPPAGLLDPGTRYRLSRGDVALTFAVPTSGWSSDGEFWFRGHPGSPEHTFLWFFTSGSPLSISGGTPGIFTDPCAHEGLRQFEESVAGEAEAIASLPGTELVSGPTDVTVDGRAAAFVAITIPEDIGCSNTAYWLSHDPVCGVRLECTSYPTWLGETMRTWIVDVDGARFVIRAESRYSDASPDLEQEIQRIVDSIQFE